MVFYPVTFTPCSRTTSKTGEFKFKQFNQALPTSVRFRETLYELFDSNYNLYLLQKIRIISSNKSYLTIFRV